MFVIYGYFRTLLDRKAANENDIVLSLLGIIFAWVKYLGVALVQRLNLLPYYVVKELPSNQTHYFVYKYFQPGQLTKQMWP